MGGAGVGGLFVFHLRFGLGLEFGLGFVFFSWVWDRFSLDRIICGSVRTLGRSSIRFSTRIAGVFAPFSGGLLAGELVV